jgi:hypothetical protein
MNAISHSNEMTKTTIMSGSTKGTSPPARNTGTTAISRRLKQVEQRGKEQGYPVILGFGRYQRMAEYIAKGIRDSGHDPFDPDLWERAVEHKGGESGPEREAPRSVEFK